jgi:hypothetical protein
VLARTTTLYALLEEYPFLATSLAARHPVLARLGDRASARRWTRVATLREVATTMDIPWLDLAREIQEEVRSVTGTVPAIAGAVSGDDRRLRDDVRDVILELERGAPIGDLAVRLDELTPGMDAEGVAALARERGMEGMATAGVAAWAAGKPTESPAPHAALHPGHPIRALQQECSRLADLAHLVTEVVDTLGDPPDGARWAEARVPLGGLVARLGEIAVQSRRLRLAWYAALGSRIGPSVPAVVSERLDEAIAALDKLRIAVSGNDAGAVTTQARTAITHVRRALAVERELLVPAAFQALDEDDWEAVAEQERVVGWALYPGRAS